MCYDEKAEKILPFLFFVVILHTIYLVGLRARFDVARKTTMSDSLSPIQQE